MKVLPGMRVVQLDFQDQGGWHQAILTNPDDTDGVRFSLQHMPTCYRRGPYKLLIEVLGGKWHHNWGCFDEQDMPCRFYHVRSCAVLEATEIANVLLANFESSEDQREVDMLHLHKNRQMFCYYNGKIIMAELGDRRSHEDWFKTLPGEPPIASTPRGFVRKHVVYIYVGGDFHIPENWEEVVWKLEGVLPVGKYDLCLGMTPADVATKWKPISVMPARVNAGQKYVRVSVNHGYICYADNESMITAAKKAIVADLQSIDELRASVQVEPAPLAGESEVPEFLTK